MKLSFFALALSLAAGSTASASMLDCEGYKIWDASGANTQYYVSVSRIAFDELPGIPVTVNISAQNNSNTAKPSSTEKVLEARSRLFPNERGGYRVEFIGGMIDVAVGNSGITGTRRALDGTLTIGEQTVQISCPQQ